MRKASIGRVHIVRYRCARCHGASALAWVGQYVLPKRGREADERSCCERNIYGTHGNVATTNSSVGFVMMSRLEEINQRVIQARSAWWLFCHTDARGTPINWTQNTGAAIHRTVGYEANSVACSVVILGFGTRCNI